MALTAAAAICAAGGWPPTPSNIGGLNAIIVCEKPAGDPWQHFNPLNTTSKWHQSYVWGSQGNISGYPDPATGAMACARTIKGMDGMRGWPSGDAALKRGRLSSEIRADPGSLAAAGWPSANCAASRLGGGAVPSAPQGPGGTDAPTAGTTAEATSFTPANPSAPFPFNVLPPSVWSAAGKLLGKAVPEPFKGIAGAATATERFLGFAPLYMEVAAGGIMLAGGIAIIAVGATGSQNEVAKLALRRTPAGGAAERAQVTTQATAEREQIRTQAVTERARAVEAAREPGRRKARASRTRARHEREREARTRQEERIELERMVREMF